MIRRALTAILVSMPLPALAGTPSEAVAFFYSPPKYEPDVELRGRFADPAKALFELNDKSLANDQEVGCLDFSPGIDAQDYDDAEIARTLKLDEAIAGNEAKVTATFNLFQDTSEDNRREIIWTLKEVDGTWLVADIESVSGKWKLSDIKCELSN